MSYQIGLVGAGYIMQKEHLPALMKEERANVLAVVSGSGQSAAEASARFDIPNVYKTEEEMYAAHDLDLVMIAVPNAYHAEAAVRAMENGVDVFCEKPPAITTAEAARMEEAASRTGRKLMYGFHHRFSQEADIVKAAAADGEIGDIYHIRVHALRRRGIPGWGTFTDVDKQGGGPLMDIGVHMLDLAFYLSGWYRPLEVSASTHYRLGRKPGVGLLGSWDPSSMSVEDFAAGFIRFEHGRSLVLETSFAANTKEEERLSVHLFGDKGGVEIDPFEMYTEKYGALLDITPAYLDQADPRSDYERQIEHILDVLEGKARPVSEPWQGTYVQQLIEAMYESAAEGRAVSLDG
ncbi:Gfo/Idh/MocA family protein [Alkalicoccus urumqiensis]|uniref:Gfo/Idh/MocA family oxidoreductase n=1 Tax=Alkalicoccus urumqiensis TaxID=1548213 RepID=A0A2P6MH15_ALKUR|nr:Gfo/Idh/MocA family oxidoreductase [Alkalicoccus urumqiensis]PRO65567.1 gfo/Idh/MocA family oxidoreductase [Alkalicoccus urumqiensis]